MRSTMAIFGQSACSFSKRFGESEILFYMEDDYYLAFYLGI